MPHDEQRKFSICQSHSAGQPREEEQTGRQDMPGWENFALLTDGPNMRMP